MKKKLREIIVLKKNEININDDEHLVDYDNTISDKF
jgi:hypothetical protein